MKRCLAPLASLLLAVSLTACGSSGSQGNAQAPAEEAEAAETTDDGKKDDLETTDDESTSDSSDAAEPVEEEETFERGTIDGDTYRSEFLGISYTLPEGFQFATDEQLAEMADLTLDELKNDVAQEAFDSGRALFDVYAYGPDGQNVSVTIEKIEAPFGMSVGAEKYREISVGKLDEQLAGTDIELVANTDVTCRIGDTDYPAEDISLSSSGATFCERLVFLNKGSFYAIVTAAAPSIEAAEELLSHASVI